MPSEPVFWFFLFFVFSFELNFNEEERACAERHKHPGLLPLLPEKAPQCLDEKVISFCNRTVRTWDQRQQAWFWGERGPAGVWAGPSPVHREKPNFCLQSEAAASPLIHQGHSHCCSGIWQQQEKADKGAEIQGDIGERKEMGCLFLSPTLQVCVYLKKTKTKTSFNWVVLVFKINQGGGWWWGWCARRPGSLAGSPAAAFWGRGPDLSPGHSCSRG